MFSVYPVVWWSVWTWIAEFWTTKNSANLNSPQLSRSGGSCPTCYKMPSAILYIDGWHKKKNFNEKYPVLGCKNGAFNFELKF